MININGVDYPDNSVEAYKETLRCTKHGELIWEPFVDMNGEQFWLEGYCVKCDEVKFRIEPNGYKAVQV